YLAADVAVLGDHPRGFQVPQGGSDSGAPQHGVAGPGGVVVPGHTGGGESVEHRYALEVSSVAGPTHTRYRHDASQVTDSFRVLAPFDGLFSACGDGEQCPAVEVVGQETGWARRRPEGFGDQGEFGQDLGRGVSTTDHGHALPGEFVRVPVVDGVHLSPPEEVTSGQV